MVFLLRETVCFAGGLFFVLMVRNNCTSIIL